MKDTFKKSIETPINSKFGSVCFRPDLFLEQNRSCSDIKNNKCLFFNECKCEHLKVKKAKK